MKLINNTPVPVSILIAEKSEPEDARLVVGIAKATFTVDESGKVTLDRNNPLAILSADVETPLGVLPKDDVPRLDPVFEVMVMGHAYAPRAKPTPAMAVSLQVGTERRVISVFGERNWQASNGAMVMVNTRDFTRQLMTWEAAFGGTQSVEIDEDSFVDLADPINPVGRGFNYESQIQGVDDTYQCPDGYPRYAKPSPLPILEDSAHLVSHPDDAPLPCCWAPCPPSSGILMERIRRAEDTKAQLGETVTAINIDQSPFLLHRAHPDWVIEPPVAEATITLEGMTENGLWEFQLPAARVSLDVSVAGVSRSLELHPNALMLFPDERRFSLLFRGSLSFRYREVDVRSARVKLDKGWQPKGNGKSNRGDPL